MLRITTHNERQSTRLVIEGRLAGSCVEELRKCWQNAILSQLPQSIRVDLTDMTGMSPQGKEMLVQMQRQGARLTGTGVMTEGFIEEIRNLS
ncbi:MAG: hypothetical protein L0387_16795 [Acidobacteria bacterium]|nr:hypothetical protein [Acidobacteriota bacterium]MCI0722208.1 hypothetical protein [Acidobacteriota bacterium]